MTLRLEPFTVVLVGIIILSFLAGRDTCACEYEEPERIEINVPVI